MLFLLSIPPNPSSSEFYVRISASGSQEEGGTWHPQVSVSTKLFCGGTNSGMMERCCVPSGILCTQCRAQGRPGHGTLTLGTMLWAWGVRLLWLWDRGAEKRGRHFLPGAFHSRQVTVLCWDTWPGRNSSWGIRHSPGQEEDKLVHLSAHRGPHELI